MKLKILTPIIVLILLVTLVSALKTYDKQLDRVKVSTPLGQDLFSVSMTDNTDQCFTCYTEYQVCNEQDVGLDIQNLAFKFYDHTGNKQFQHQILEYADLSYYERIDIIEPCIKSWSYQDEKNQTITEQYEDDCLVGYDKKLVRKHGYIPITNYIIKPKTCRFFKVRGNLDMGEAIDNKINFLDHEIDRWSWWNNSWAARVNVTVVSTDSHPYIDLPLNVTDYSDNGIVINHQGNASADCSDVRVVCSSYEPDFAISSCSASTVSLTWQQNVSANGNTSCSVYYDNAGASAINKSWDLIRFNILNTYTNTSDYADTGQQRQELGSDAADVTLDSANKHLDLAGVYRNSEVVSYYNLSNSPTAHWKMRYAYNQAYADAFWTGGPATQSDVDGVGPQASAGTGHGVGTARFQRSGTDREGVITQINSGSDSMTLSTAVDDATDLLWYETFYRDGHLNTTFYTDQYVTVKESINQTGIDQTSTKFTNHTIVSDFTSWDDGTANGPSTNDYLTNFTFWKVPKDDAVISYAIGSEETQAGGGAANNAPTISAVDVLPDSPNSTHDLDCNATVLDAENTSLQVEYFWYNATTEMLSGNKTNVANNTLTIIDTLGLGNTTDGETWNCTIRVWDGEDWSASYDSDTETITDPAGGNTCTLPTDGSNHVMTMDDDCNSTANAIVGNLTLNGCGWWKIIGANVTVEAIIHNETCVSNITISSGRYTITG